MDTIEEIKKGAKGADALITVRFLAIPETVPKKELSEEQKEANRKYNEAG